MTIVNAKRKVASVVKRKRVTLPMVITAVPVILVNAVAVFGQLEFLHSRMPWNFAADILFAVALESIAVFLAYSAHKALLANDSAMRLRMAAYVFAGVVGVTNGSHYLARVHVTFAALGMTMMSASSPWLWSVYSRRVARDTLMRLGLIEPHAIRLGMNRFLFHPVRSFCVYRHAVWEGEQNVQRAIKAVYPVDGMMPLTVKAETGIRTSNGKRLTKV
jgi:hypothetical protein